VFDEFVSSNLSACLCAVARGGAKKPAGLCNKVPDISQGSAATRLSCSGKYIEDVITILLQIYC